MIQDCIAVIQAGGRGERMIPLTKDLIPKPMLLLNGKPMLEWQIAAIARYGIREFVIIVGYLGNKIKDYLGDGSKLGVYIQYIEENEPLGSGGAFSYLGSVVRTRNFLLVYGDIMFDVNLERMLAFHESHCGYATLLAHPNAHPYDSDLLVIGQRDCVKDIDSKHNCRDYWYENCVNAGIYIFSTNILDNVYKPGKKDLEQDILRPLIKEGKVFAYRSPEYVKDAGTPERFCKVSREQQEGIWRKKNLENRQVCIFLDRDGTVNRYRGLLYMEEQFELEDGVAEAIRRLNEAGYLVILVTNQPVVARGLCGIEDVERIHRKMQVLLGEEGAYLDDIMFCPHHPDKGYPEENIQYKIPCNCRKPATGMISEAAEKYNIDLTQSYMIGDSTIDMQTGKNAGLRTILLLTGQAGKDGKYDVTADISADNLMDAVMAILDDCAE
ncbi:MAG: HAD-IIIA family hydrolase [Acetatifactor sp.]